MAYNPQTSPIRPLGEGLGSCDSLSIRPDVAKRLWLYATNDAPSEVEAANYFPNQVLLARGDVIMASMNNGVGALPVAKLYVVLIGVASGDGNNILALFSNTAG